MTDERVDLLQIKIEVAKRKLPPETLNAINAVDWKAEIIKLREKKGYTFEQLGDLELETELLLCGLIAPEDYPKELEKRMGISKAAADELVNEMNELVFKKIRQELIKNIERKKIFERGANVPANSPLEEYPEAKPQGEVDKIIHPILAQKLSASVQIPAVKTEHTLENITRAVSAPETGTKPAPTSYPPGGDPYREMPK